MSEPEHGRCPICEGTGVARALSVHFCQACNGTGKLSATPEHTITAEDDKLLRQAMEAGSKPLYEISAPLARPVKLSRGDFMSHTALSKTVFSLVMAFNEAERDALIAADAQHDELVARVTLAERELAAYDHRNKVRLQVEAALARLKQATEEGKS